MIGLLYFIDIILVNTLVTISGMETGLLIKPIFDLLHFHGVVAISFYAGVAVFTMAIVSTIKGVHVHLNLLLSISLGALVGGVLE